MRICLRCVVGLVCKRLCCLSAILLKSVVLLLTICGVTLGHKLHAAAAFVIASATYGVFATHRLCVLMPRSVGGCAVLLLQVLGYIRAAKRPVLLLGGGCVGCDEALLNELVDVMGAPVVYTFMGKVGMDVYLSCVHAMHLTVMDVLHMNAMHTRLPVTIEEAGSSRSMHCCLLLLQ